MSCPMDQQSLEKLKQFVNFVKLQPNILHLPQLSFFKEFMESFGGTVPEPTMTSENKEKKTQEDPKADDNESEPESELELDMSGCIEADKLSDDQKMGNSTKEVTEEEADKADEKRREAMSEFSAGNYDKAIALFTEAIEINPNSALLFAKRGQTYLKLNKPNACIKDCTRALELNPDSATSYKFRGRSYRLLGEFELAAKDLRQACNIDFDEQTDEWLKEVTPNAKKIEEHLLKKERKRKDKEEKERLERVRKAKEAHAKAASDHSEPDSADSPSAPGGMPSMGDFYKLLQDPEIMNALKDPEIAAAFQDISKNPSNMFKYQSNPKIQDLLGKLSGKFSGSDMNFSGFPGGFPFGFGGGKPAQTGDDNLD
ncbi:putative protein FAM10A4 [Rhynchophorus ferrugineus]|uniref:putative protein FAM10A4 n=1 Tax=Rhynchophorus ferrugineus TaxID=354439 RepID=UPI003FCCB118